MTLRGTLEIELGHARFYSAERLEITFVTIPVPLRRLRMVEVRGTNKPL